MLRLAMLATPNTASRTEKNAAIFFSIHSCQGGISRLNWVTHESSVASPLKSNLRPDKSILSQLLSFLSASTRSQPSGRFKRTLATRAQRQCSNSSAMRFNAPSTTDLKASSNPLAVVLMMPGSCTCSVVERWPACPTWIVLPNQSSFPCLQEDRFDRSADASSLDKITDLLTRDINIERKHGEHGFF